jgi:hypothetical protein
LNDVASSPNSSSDETATFVEKSWLPARRVPSISRSRGPERSANLRDVRQSRDQQSQPCHWNEYRLERRNRREDVGLELGSHDGPATNAEVRAKEQLAIVGEVGRVFEGER